MNEKELNQSETTRCGDHSIVDRRWRWRQCGPRTTREARRRRQARAGRRQGVRELARVRAHQLVQTQRQRRRLELRVAATRSSQRSVYNEKAHF